MGADSKHYGRGRDGNGAPRMTDPTAEAAPPAGRNPFVNRDYRAWVTASVVMALGVGIQIVTVPLFIRDRVEPDERAAVIAGALIIQTLPGVFLTLLGGVNRGPSRATAAPVPRHGGRGDGLRGVHRALGG